MKPEELPEDSLTESELETYGDLLTKYFDGKVPTEKEQKSALNFLVRTHLSCSQQKNPYDGYFNKNYSNPY